MQVNLKGDLFVANHTAILRMPADKQGKPTIESNYFQDVYDLFYKSDELFFVGQDANLKTGLFMKPVKHEQEKSNVIVSLTQQHQVSDDVRGIASFDTMIYYTESGKVYTIEAF